MAEDRVSSPQAPAEGFSSTLDSILSNPEMMSMITSIAERLKENSAQASETSAEGENRSAPASKTEQRNPSDIIGALSPLLSASEKHQSKRSQERACLLRALKPYLSSGRSEAIDYIIKFSNIADVLKELS